MELKNTEKLEHSQVKLTVAVSAEELDKAKEAAYKKSKNQFQIPGFRKGKATRKVIERLYGKDFFVNDAINNLYPEMYPQALEAAGIEPVGQGDVKIDERHREELLRRLRETIAELRFMGVTDAELLALLNEGEEDAK